MNTQIKEKKHIISLIFYLFWFSLILSINTKIEELGLLGKTLIESINSLRLIIPLILSAIFIILNFFFIYSKKKPNHSIISPK
jgi:hypothetical protein